MKLVGSPNSPFARKVRVVLIEKALPYEWVSELPMVPDTRVPDYNPLGKIPVLVTDSGRTLFDSRVIVEYLETLPPRSRFTPTDDTGRIEVKRWEALADGCSDAQAQIVFERRRSNPQTISPDWIAWQAAKIDRSLAAMADELGGRTWCHGNELSLADIAVVSSLGHLSVRLKEFAWRGSASEPRRPVRPDARAAVVPRHGAAGAVTEPGGSALEGERPAPRARRAAISAAGGRSRR